MIGLTLACTMAIVGDSAKASRRQVGGGQLRRRLRRQQRLRRAVLAGDRRPRWRSRRRRAGASGSASASASHDGDPTYVVADRPGDDRRARPRPWTPAGATRPGRRHGPASTTDWARRTTSASATPSSSRCRPASRQWRIVGIFEDTPMIFSPVLTTIADPDRRRLPRPGQLRAGLHRGRSGRGRAPGRLDAVVEDLPIVTVKDQAAFAAEQREPIDQLVLMIYALLGAGAGDRRPRHRQHARAVGHRADPRDRPAARDRASAAASCG